MASAAGSVQAGGGRGWARRAAQAAGGLYPGYFALVMATGIVSTACALEGLGRLSRALLWVGAAAHVVLVGLYLVRAVRFWPRFRADLTDARSMFAFFTFVAADGVLGTRLLLGGGLAGGGGLPWLLFILAASAWLALTYLTFGALFFGNRRSLPEAVSGGWLIAVVGTQSVAILGVGLAGAAPALAPLLLAAGYGLWAVGVGLYALFIAFIMMRLAFFEVRGRDLAGPYWVNMGATAISTVAGASLYAHAARLPALAHAAPVLYGVTWGLWAWGTWWIPLLVAMGVWKHGVQGVPLAYDPALWSMVFPLGMYTVATLSLAGMTGLQGLRAIAGVFVWIAVAAWTWMFAGLLRALAGAALRRA
jgi:tellurite resistance protein TehA-like permease